MNDIEQIIGYAIVLSVGVLVIMLLLGLIYGSRATSTQTLTNQFGTPTSTTSNQPDVIVQYANAVYVSYNAIPETNVARGNLVISILANAVQGESVYLNNKTFNIGAGNLQLNGSGATVNDVALYGSGKYTTHIIGGGGVVAGINSIIADLNFNGIFVEVGTEYGNDLMRNDYFGGYIDGIFFSATPSFGNVIFYNTTATSGYDSFNVGSSSVNVIIIDSYLHPILNNSGGQNTGLFEHGLAGYDGPNSNIILVNSIINISSAAYSCNTQKGGCVGIAGTNVLVYGGSISTVHASGNIGGANGGGYDIYNPSNTIKINSTTIYNSLNVYNPPSNTLTQFGPYSYLHAPLTPPGGPYTQTSNGGVSGAALNYTNTAGALSASYGGNLGLWVLAVIFVIIIIVVYKMIKDRNDGYLK